VPCERGLIAPYGCPRRNAWLDSGVVRAVIDHAAVCGPPAAPSAVTRPRTGGRWSSNRHAAVVLDLVARAGAARGEQQARLAVRCVCSLLDAGGVLAAKPLLHLLLGLWGGAAAGCGSRGGTPQPPQEQQHSVEVAPQQREAARRAIAEAVAGCPMLLEVLQDLYAQTAWHLPMAEMLAKLRSERGRLGARCRQSPCVGGKWRGQARDTHRASRHTLEAARPFAHAADQSACTTLSRCLPPLAQASAWALRTCSAASMTATRPSPPPGRRPPGSARRRRPSPGAPCGGRRWCRGCRWR
jgi:hypothetical protein